jgi:hypothetical protein
VYEFLLSCYLIKVLVQLVYQNLGGHVLLSCSASFMCVIVSSLVLLCRLLMWLYYILGLLRLIIVLVTFDVPCHSCNSCYDLCCLYICKCNMLLIYCAGHDF